MGWIRKTKDGIEIDILVAPKAARFQFVGIHDDRLKVRIDAPPLEGKANKVLIRALGRTLRTPKGDLLLVRGASGRRKTILVVGAELDAVKTTLTEAMAGNGRGDAS